MFLIRNGYIARGVNNEEVGGTCVVFAAGSSDEGCAVVLVEADFFAVEIVKLIDFRVVVIKCVGEAEVIGFQNDGVAEIEGYREGPDGVVGYIRLREDEIEGGGLWVARVVASYRGGNESEEKKKHFSKECQAPTRTK